MIERERSEQSGKNKGERQRGVLSFVDISHTHTLADFHVERQREQTSRGRIEKKERRWVGHR